MNYLIAGGTGFIGKALVKYLSTNPKNTIYLLVRNLENHNYLCENIQLVLWESIYSNFSVEMKHFDAVINLVGENLSKGRWTNQRKKDLYNSRIDSGKFLLKQLKAQNISVSHYVGASAVGFYGDRGTELLDESAPSGSGYLASLCQAWEVENQSWESYAEHTSLLRLGMVLGKNGGVLQRMVPLFSKGLGGRMGSGMQYVGWIHIYDLTRLIEFCSSSEQYEGVINAVSPYQINNLDFSDCLGKTLRKSAGFNIPAFVMKTVLGEFSSVVLGGAKIEAKRLKELKFHYRFPTIELALKDVVSKV